MKSTPCRSKTDHVQKTARPAQKRKKPTVPGVDHQAIPLTKPVEEVDARRLTPQAAADAQRDTRLVKDLQDNANRSDLAKHRREISATKEDHEEADEDEEEDMLHVEQESEATSFADPDS